ncbi:MAG: LTA synthase family protein [Oscillospiraceae bacterium]|nr:LTA synthase family protein [Oscillospiraceae bacterium]
MSTAYKTAARPGRINIAFQKFSGFFEKHPYSLCALTALILNSIIEIYSRHSIADYIISCFKSPFVFFYSIMIITLTLLISLLFTKRIFVYMLISTLWLALGITNGTVLLFRVTPLTGVDFSIIWSVLGIIEIYLKPWQIVLISAAILSAIVLLVFLAIKTPKTKALIKKGALSIFTLGLAILLATTIGLEAGAISDEFPNLADAYDEYGFAYCFARSVLDTGIKRPDSYDDTMDNVRSDIEDKMVSNNSVAVAKGENPNVIVIQLESFFDPTYMTDYTLSEDPIPNFRALKETCPSGFLTVPAVGAGTANTEFEVLTGMTLDFFGTCEYPYKTVLNDTATCSLCTDLKSNGYAAHAMHNNTGTFYDRDTVYSYLGFDTFTPLEYMLSPTYNEIGWADDSVLTNEIIRAIHSTEERDFVFAVSVQPHGKYPREEYNGSISVSGGTDEGLTNAVEYYVNQIHEVDLFIGQLIETFKNFDEPVVLVLYGDHLPALELENSTVSTGDIFKTEYVFWSNCSIKAESRDLESWQLAPYIMETLELEGGPVTTLHRECGDDETFMTDLEALEYDLFYGEFKMFDGENPYKPTEMQMGAVPIEVTGWFEADGNLYIKGRNFTEFSKVYIDESDEETIFINRFTLMVPNVTWDGTSSITVAQETEDGIVLGWAVNK